MTFLSFRHNKNKTKFKKNPLINYPDEPFSFGKPKRQTNLSGREFFDVELNNNIVYAIRGSDVYYDQESFERLYPKLLEQLIEAG